MKVAINKVIEFNGEDGGHVLREARTVPLQEHEREREVWLRLEKKKVNGELLMDLQVFAQEFLLREHLTMKFSCFFFLYI